MVPVSLDLDNDPEFLESRPTVGGGEAGRSAAAYVVDHPEYSDHRRARIAVSPVWLYSETLPPVTGTPSATQASLSPRQASANCHITAGASGGPEVREVGTA